MSGKIVVGLGMQGVPNSLLAEALRELGIHFIDMSPGDSGASEDTNTFSRIAEDLLRHFAGERECPVSPHLPPGWFRDRKAIAAAHELRPLIKEALGDGASVPGIRNPLAAHLIPLLDQVFMAENVTPAYILAVQNPADFIADASPDTPESQAFASWATYHTEATLNTAANFLVVNVSEFGSKTADVCKRIAAHIGLDTPKASAALTRKLKAIVPESRDGGQTLPADVAALYAPFDTPSRSKPEDFLSVTDAYAKAVEQAWLWGDKEGVKSPYNRSIAK